MTAFLRFQLGDLSCLQRDSALSVCPWTCSYSDSHALGASFFVDFCVFNLGTSSAFSAIERHRFVHAHFHILISMAWEHPFSLTFAFSIWALLVPSARFTAISFSMDMLTFSHYHDFIIMSQLQCHDDHIVTSILKSFWMHFGSRKGDFLDHFGVMLSSEIVLEAHWKLC